MTQRQAFFIGIKGVGMTALAIAMQEAGWQVSGSDTDEEFITDEVLSNKHIEVKSFSDSLPQGLDLIVCSTAYAPPKTSVKTLSLAEALAEFVVDRQVIAVAGVGGKTTTSAMLAALFHAAGRDIGYYVGTSTIAGLPTPGHHGTDPYFVVEADEYAISKTDRRPKFAILNPKILITTNIVHDHPDIYPDSSATLAAFRQLVERLPADGTWLCNPEDPLTHKLLSTSDYSCTVIKYGADHELYNQLKLSVFGEQNRLDGLAAVLAAVSAGLSQPDALKSISAYSGAGRRQEFHGEVGGRLLYDDYGHHPAEIAVTVKSFKDNFPGSRVILVFESHTYSRTQKLLPEFALAIGSADIPFIMPIFESAREKGQVHKVTPQSFAQSVARHNPACRSLTWDNAAQIVAQTSRPGDLILTMGAGFVYKLHRQIKELL